MPMSRNCLIPASTTRKRSTRCWNPRTAGAMAVITGAAAARTRAALRSASKLLWPPYRKSTTRAAFGTVVLISAAFARRVASSPQSSAMATSMRQRMSRMAGHG